MSQCDFAQALRNLVNRSRYIAVQIFRNLDRRLKSTDEKNPNVIGEEPVVGPYGEAEDNDQAKQTS